MSIFLKLITYNYYYKQIETKKTLLQSQFPKHTGFLPNPNLQHSPANLYTAYTGPYFQSQWFFHLGEKGAEFGLVVMD